MGDSGKQEGHGDKRLIRNSTAEFLMFTGQSSEQSIEARYEDETIWLSQKLMAELYDVDIRPISEHLKNIFEHGEREGSREVTQNVDFYNLDAIISVGYQVNSVCATQFRQWATQILRKFAVKAYVLDKKRMENGSYLGEDYFEHLLGEIREILQNSGKLNAKLAKEHADTEFEKYRILQDRLFESDFDRVIKQLNQDSV